MCFSSHRRTGTSASASLRVASRRRDRIALSSATDKRNLGKRLIGERRFIDSGVGQWDEDPRQTRRSRSDVETSGDPPRLDRPGASMAVRLTGDRGESRITMTDDDGDFEFTSVQAGAYQLFVDVESLPDYWSVLTDEPETITLNPGDRVEGLSFWWRRTHGRLGEFS